jgi:hypothetical protein
MSIMTCLPDGGGTLPEGSQSMTMGREQVKILHFVQDDINRCFAKGCGD